MPKTKVSCAKSPVPCESCGLQKVCVIYRAYEIEVNALLAIRELCNIEETKAEV